MLALTTLFAHPLSPFHFLSHPITNHTAFLPHSLYPLRLPLLTQTVFYERTGLMDADALSMMTTPENLIAYHYLTMSYAYGRHLNAIAAWKGVENMPNFSIVSVIDLQGMSHKTCSSIVLAM